MILDGILVLEGACARSDYEHVLDLYGLHATYTTPQTLQIYRRCLHNRIQNTMCVDCVENFRNETESSVHRLNAQF